MGWGLLALAVGIGVGIGLARARWESAYNEVQLAVYLDKGLLSAPLSGETIREMGITAIVVSPSQVGELRTQFFPLRGHDALISLDELHNLISQGIALYWNLDAWVPPAMFAPFLEKLFRERSRGFLLSFPYALGPSGADPWLSQLSQVPGDEAVAFAVLEFSGFAQQPELIALYRSGCSCAVVRAHTLSEEDAQRLRREERITRYVRAVRERNVRLLILRASLPTDLRQEAAALSQRLRHMGFSVGGLPRPEPFETAATILALLWSAALVGLSLLFPTRNGLFRGLLGALAVGGGIALLFGGDLARVAAAAGLAAVAPALGFLLGYRHAHAQPLPLEGPRRATRTAAALLLTTGIALMGGLLAAALLSSELYFLKLLEPRGIKATLVVPLALVAVAVLCGRSIREFRLGDGAAWAVVLVASIIALWRSGNVSPGESPLLEWEIRLRQALEGALGIRPRFKEFLVGYPLLLLAFGLYIRNKRPAIAALLVLGTIGPVSTVNTFLHMHTPLWVTLVRSLYGLGLGLVLGLGLWAVIAAAGRLRRRPHARRVD